MDPVILLVIGIALVLVIGVIIFAFTRGGGGDKVTQDRLDQFTDLDGTSDKKKKKKEDSEKTPSKLTQNIDEAIEGKGFVQKIRVQLAQANLKITPTEYIMVIFISIVLTAALAFILFHRSLPLALGGAALGFFLPKFYLGMRKGKRLKEFNHQLGDTITLIANGLRSGYSILQAMESVGTEMPAPISEEFARVVREVQLGVSNERAMNNMVRRIPSDDLDLMITAINVQHEVGGNLAEILEIIGFVIRERVRIQGEIKTLTAQGMISGYVLSFMPIILGLILFAMNQEYVGRMVYANDTQPCGWIMISVGLILIGLGFTAIMKIVKIEV